MARAQRQLGFAFRTWGGVRTNAGRPPKGKAAGVSHLRRPSQSLAHPLHITLRVGRGIPSLREPALFAVVRRALDRGKRQFGFSLAQFSVQRDHLHLIAEANDRRALSRGMQGLSIRVARAVNAQLGRSGKLFVDRYHARALTTPRTVRLALRYVLLNVRKHLRAPQGSAEPPVKSRKESLARAPQGSAELPVKSRKESLARAPQGSAELPVKSRKESLARAPKGPAETPQASAHIPGSGFVDACSSAPWFADFERPAALAFGARAAQSQWERESGGEPPVAAPRSWLLRTGWKRAGPFDIDDVPGA